MFASLPLLTTTTMWFSNLFQGVTTYPMSWQAAISLVVVVILLLLSGYMSSSETAYFSLSPQDINTIKESDAHNDKRLLNLLEHSEQLLATILIGNNVVNMAIVFLSNYALFLLIDFGGATTLRFVLQTIALTFLLLLFGEITPKVIARKNPLAMSRFSTPLMVPLFHLLKPMSKALMATSNHTKGKEEKGKELSVDELSKAVELTEGKSPEQSEIMEGIIRFHDKTAVEIMVPRIDMVDVDYTWPFSKVLALVVESGNSRLPVFEGTQDNIKGILYIKDNIPYIGEGDLFDWHKLIRPAYFVPENKMLDELLEEFRAERIHMAIVVDEYGGTSGIVTLEDILEEIVGEISDEYDEVELPYTLLADGSYLFQAKTQLSDFCRLLGIDYSFFDDVEQEVDTLGGVFLEVKQELPHVGDKVQYRGMELEVVDLEKLRIQQMRITLPRELRPKTSNL